MWDSSFSGCAQWRNVSGLGELCVCVHARDRPICVHMCNSYVCVCELDVCVRLSCAETQLAVQNDKVNAPAPQRPRSGRLQASEMQCQAASLTLRTQVQSDELLAAVAILIDVESVSRQHVQSECAQLAQCVHNRDSNVRRASGAQSHGAAHSREEWRDGLSRIHLWSVEGGALCADGVRAPLAVPPQGHSNCRRRSRWQSHELRILAQPLLQPRRAGCAPSSSSVAPRASHRHAWRAAFCARLRSTIGSYFSTATFRPIGSAAPTPAQIALACHARARSAARAPRRPSRRPPVRARRQQRRHLLRDGCDRCRLGPRLPCPLWRAPVDLQLQLHLPGAWAAPPGATGLPRC